MLDLPDAGLEVLRVIVEAPEAWVQADPIERQRPGVLAMLEADGLVELWDRPDYRAVTLTPLAAERLHVQILEHWVFESRDVGGDQVPSCHHVERVAEEVPGWAPADVVPGPVVLPRRAREVPLPFPDRAEAPWDGPRQAAKEDTGVRIMGTEVRVDRRMRQRGA